MIRWSFTLLGLVLASEALGGPAEAVAAALGDARTLAPEVRTRTRYLTLYAVPQDRRAGLVRTLGFLTNALSREAEIVRPRPVGPDLLAVILDDYGWKRETWETLAGVDPYFHVLLEQLHQGRKRRVAAAAPWLDARQISDLIRLTQSQAPVVRADWWFSRAVRQLSLNNANDDGVGYYDWLGLKDRAAYFRLLRLDEQASRAIQKEVRAAVADSGVATHNRQIVRLQALTGGAWATLDTDDESGRGNATLNLRRGDYQHRAEEHYGVLPNGLPVVFLSDANGKRQDSAPDFIGPDDSDGVIGRDARIHVGLACFRCHTEVLRRIDDWARRTYRDDVQLTSPDYATLKELRRQYLSNLDRHLARDRAVYAEAIAEATDGWQPAALSAGVVEAWNRYAEDRVGPETAARELGVDLATMGAAFRRSGNPDLLNLARREPIPMSRPRWEEAFPLAMTTLGGVR